jgi:hypothetical protein
VTVLPAIPSPLPDPYWPRVRALAGRLHEHFAAAVRRGFRTPSEPACIKLAQTLLTVENVEQNLQRPQEQARVKLVRALRRAAELAAPVRDDFARIAEYWDDDETRATVRGIDRLLEQIARVRPRLWGTPHDPAIAIATAARVAWASANEGRYPRSLEPKSPMVRFVCAALGEITGETEKEVSLKPSTVSRVLKGKRHKYAPGGLAV